MELGRNLLVVILAVALSSPAFARTRCLCPASPCACDVVSRDRKRILKYVAIAAVAGVVIGSIITKIYLTPKITIGH